MSDRNLDPREDDKVFRETLQRWEAEHAPTAPSFESVRRKIMTSPSPLEAPRWSAGRSLRLAGALMRRQLRIVPWLVVPVALVTATMAVLAARFFGSSQDASAALSGFASLMLVGIALTVTMALSTAKPDAVSLATPLGPQVVVLARLAVVLVIDAIAGLAASGLVCAWGYAGTLPELLAGWMIPLAAIAGVVTFVAIWVAPWAGTVSGLVLIPLASPTSAAGSSIGFGAVTGALWQALTPAGLLIVGCVLFTGAISSARRAALAGVQAI